MLRMLLPLVLLLLLGAGAQDKKKAKNEQVRKQYAAFMAELSKENKAIRKDLEEKKGDAAIKTRLMSIRKNAEAASKLDYWNGDEEEVGKFKTMFEIFLDIRLKAFLEASWNPESGEKLYERLQGACRTCHELFRD